MNQFSFNRLRSVLFSSLLFLPAFQSLPAVEREEDLVLWFHFDDDIPGTTVVNQAGIAELNGEISGEVVQEDSPFGKALKFDGVGNKITVTHDSRLDVEYTVSIWMNSVKSNDQWVGVFGRPGRHYNLWAGNSNTDSWFVHHRYRDGGNGSAGPGDAGGLTHGEWWHVVLTNDGQQSRTYVNGEEKATANLSDLNYQVTNLYVGADLDNGNRAFYEGLMDDVRLYNVAMTAEEVAAIYNGGNGDFNTPPVITITGDQSVRVPFGGTYSEEGVTVSDPDGDTLSEVRTEYIPPQGMIRRHEIVARWSFDVDGSDDIGNGNDGTLELNAAIEDAKFGKGIALDGIGSYVSIPQFNGLDAAPGFSVSAWVKFNDLSSDGVIFATQGATDPSFIWVDTNSGPEPFLSFNAGDNFEPTNRVQATESSLQVDTWHHLVAVMDGKIRKVYIDGVLKGTETQGVDEAIGIHGRSLAVGSWDQVSMDLNGVIDEVRVYSVALSDEEITAMYSNGDGDVQDEILTVDGNVLGDWIVRYSVEDSEGAITVMDRNVRVFDPMAPVLSVDPGVVIQHEQGTPFTLPVVTARDAGGELIQDADITRSGDTVDPDVAGSYVLEYDYTDSQSRPAETLFVTVNVVDTTPPQLTIVGDEETTHLVGHFYNDFGATAVDSVDGDILVDSTLYSWSHIIAKGYMLGSRPETLMVFDQNDGLLSQPADGEVVFDSLINFNGDASFQSIGSGITRNDNFQNLFVGVFRAKVEGEYEFGTDGPDDLATMWLDLNQNGVYESNGTHGSEWMTMGTRGGYSTVYLKPGIYNFAIGHMEGGGGSRVLARWRGPDGGGPSALSTIHPANSLFSGHWGIAHPIDYNEAGTYTVTYTATDASGNSSTATRTVVIKDAIDLPVILLAGDPVMEIEVGGTYTEPGFTVESAFGDDLDEQGVLVSGTIDTNILGEQHVHYTFVDDQGIPAEPVTRTVWVVDTEPPEIVLTGEAEITITNAEVFTDPGVTISDNDSEGLLVSTNLGFPADGLILHVDASQLDLEDGAVITSWQDLSGNSNHFNLVQGEPTFAEDAINGMPAVEINGQDLLTNSTSFGRTYSIFTISRLSGLANERMISSQNSNWFLGYWGGYEDQMHADGWVSNNTNTSTTDPHLYVALNRNNNQTRFYADTEYLTFIPTRNGAIGMLQFGGYASGSERGWGFISEVLLYDREVTEQERRNIETYLNAKYGLNGIEQTPVTDFSTPGTYTIHYIAKDDSGNAAHETRTVTVIEDPDKPVITLVGEAFMTLEAGTEWVDPGFTLETIAGADLDESLVAVSPEPNAVVPGFYQISYTLDDGNGKVADPVSREVHVVDTTGPEILLEGNVVMTIELGADFTDPGATAVDIVDGDVGVMNNLEFPIEGLVLDLDATHYQGTLNDGDVVDSLWEDASGAGHHMDNLEGAGALWIEDGLNGEPVLRFNGDSYMYTSYNFDALTGHTIITIARYSGGKMGRVISSDSRNWLFGFHGGYTGCWHAEGWIVNTHNTRDMDWHLHSGIFIPEADPKASMWKNGELLVKDNTGSNNGVYKPGRLGIGAWNSATNQSSQCEVARVLVYDRPLSEMSRRTAEVFLNARYSLNGSTPGDLPGVNVNIAGTYTIGYEAIDSAGNVSSLVRTIYVVEDIQQPVLTLNGNSEVFITVDSSYTEAGVSITDDAGAIPANLVINGSVDTTKLGSYNLEYTYASSNGKSAAPITRIVHVIDDVPPTLTLVGDSTVEVILGADYTDAGATVSDNVVPAAQVLPYPSDPVAIYLFSDITNGAQDSSGNLHNGELQAGAMVLEGGKYGNGLFVPQVLNARLDLVGNAVDIGEDGEWTFASWFKGLYPKGGTWRSIVSGTSIDYHVMVEPNSEDLGFYANNRGNFRSSGFPMQPSKYQGWNHFAAVGRGDNTDFFINGLKVGSSDRNSTSDLRYIGNRGDWWFSEMIDEVYIYQRSLSESEIYHLQYAQPEISTDELGTQKLAWFAVDAHGNRAETLRKIKIIPDPEIRYIELLGDSEITIEAGEDYLDPGSRLLDSDGNEVTGQDVVVGGIPENTLTPGEYTITFNSTTAEGKTSPEVVRVLKIVDTIPPVIELIGNNPYVLPLGAEYLEPGAVAMDVADGVVSAVPVLNIPSKGLILHLNAGDIAGLADGEVVTSWPDSSGADHPADNVVNDPTWHENALNGHPVVRFDGDDLLYTTHDFSSNSEFTILLVARYTGGQNNRVLSSRSGRNWLVGYWGNRYRSLYLEGWVYNPGGSNTNWHLHGVVARSDAKVDFWVDRQLLAYKQTGANSTNFAPKEIQLGGWEDGQEASQCEVAEVIFYNRKLDSSEMMVAQTILDAKYGLGFGATGIVSSLDPDTPGIYNVAYVAEDSSGNTASAVRRITVLDPSILPVISLNGDAEITLEAGEEVIDPGATVSDPQGQPIDLSQTPILVSGHVDRMIPGIYNLAYDFLSEDRRRAATVLRKYTVVDTTGPVITMNSGDTLRFPVGAEFSDPGVVVTDLVDGEVSFSSSLIKKNKILHRGFMGGWAETDVYFHGNKGALIKPGAGENYLQGPLDLNGDASFMNAGVGITHHDNFQNLFLSTFNAKVEGYYEFAITNRDDLAVLWLDADQDGVFEIDGDNGNEWMNYGVLQGGRIVYLYPGFYKFAAFHREGSGGSRITAAFRTPEGAGPTIMAVVDPTAPEQDGLWNEITEIDAFAPGEHTIEYTAKDAAGNVTTVSRTVIFESIQDAPIIYLDGNREMTIAAGTDFTDPGATVESKEGTPLDASRIVATGIVDTSRPGIYQVQYNFVDAATSVAAKTTIRKVIVSDLVPPVLTLLGEAEMTHHIGTEWQDPGATAVDNVDGVLQVKTTESVPLDHLVLHLDAGKVEGLEDGDVLSVWRDLSGNQNHLEDNIGNARYLESDIGGRPAILFDGSAFYATKTNFGNRYTIASVARYDGNRNGRLLASRTDNWIFGFHSNHVNCFHPNGWAAGPAGWQGADDDPHLNIATADSVRVEFWGDGVNLTSWPNRVGNIGQFQLGAYLEGTESASGMVSEVLLYDKVLPDSDLDAIQFYLNKKYGLEGDKSVNGPVDPSVPGEYEILYSVTDSSGNEVTARRIVHVIPAPGAPVLTLAGDQHIHHQANDAYVDPGAVLTDSDGNVLDDSLIVVDNPVVADVPGEYLVTYNYVDLQGRAAPQITRIVTVADTRAPVITLNGDATIKLAKDAELIDPGATALDSRDGDLPAYSSLELYPGRLEATGYLITFSDALMNIDQNMGLLAQTPAGDSMYYSGSLSINGATNFRATTNGVNSNDRFAINYHGLFIATEDGSYEFGNNTIDDRMAFWVDLDQDGVFEANGDKGSETFVSNWQTGHRSVDLTAGHYPVAILFMENTGGERFEPTYKVPGGARTVIHPAEQPAHWATPSTTVIDTSVPGTYTIEYVSVDNAGNISTAIRNVVVVEDATLPFLTLNGEEEVYHEAGTPYEDLGAKATDENNQVLEVKVTSPDPVDINFPGTYTLLYNYTDASQNAAIPISRTVFVRDTIAPVITITAHTGGGVETVSLVVGDTWEDPGATVTDNFDTTIHVYEFADIADAYYSFDDELEPGRDDSASGFHLGALLSGAQWSPDGKIGGALELPLASRQARMEVGPIDIDGAWAATAWFQELHVHGNWRTLFRGQTGDHQVIVQNNGTRLGMYDTGGGRNFVPSTFNLYPNDRWQHIAVSGEGEETNYFIDGELVATIDAKSNTDIWRIGAWPDQGFARLLDEIYIFPNSLTQGEVKAIRALKEKVDTTEPGTFHVPYFAKDAGGNFVSLSRTVVVEPDPQAPILVLNGEELVQVEAGTNYTDSGATAKLEDNTVLNNNVAGEGTVDTSAPGDYVLTYNFDDGQGKTALPITRTIQVRDTVSPEITLTGPDSLIIALGDVFVDPGATAVDSFEGDLQVESSAQFPSRGLILDLDARSLRGIVGEGEVVTVWGDSSGSGNDMDNYTGNGATYHDNVLNGHPVLRLDGASYHWTTRDFQDLENGYTILAISRYAEGDKHGRVIGSTRRNWLFGYYNGNTASWHPEGWVYNADGGTDLDWHLHAGKIIANDDPVASFWKDGVLRISDNRGSNNTYFYPGQLAIGAARNVGEQPAFGEVSRILMYDRPLDDDRIEMATRILQGQYGLHGKDVTDTYTIPTDREGEHTITYSAIDSAGNETIETRTVIVMDNPPVPSITLLPDAEGNINIFIEAGNPFVDPGAQLSDRYGNEIDASEVVISGTVDHSVLGSYTLKYDYTDDRGFPANRKLREIQVVDTTPPEITLDGALRYRLPIGTEFVDPGFSAIDNLDGVLPVTASLQSKIEGLIINWDFNDGNGTTLTDVKGGVNGTLVNFDDPNAAWVDGKYGKGLQFDGVKTYIQIPGTEKLDLQDFTFSVWFKSPNVLHNGFIFEKTTDGITNTQYGLFFDSQDLFTFRVNEFADFHDSFFTTTDELRNNTWHHLVATYDGQIKTIYVDGQEVVISDAGFTLNTNPLGPSYIGAFAPGDGFHYNGILDEIQVYDRALGIDDIDSISGPSGINYTQKSTAPYVIEYTSTDSQGNTATIEREIAVSNDDTPPELTLNGDASMILTINSVFSDPGATAIDNEDGPLTPFINVEGIVDTAKPGVYLLTYSIEDFSFNAATPITRTVQVGDPIAKWLAETGLDAHPAAEQDMSADPDQDQFTNLLEYALGSDPTSSSDAAHLAEPGFSSNHMTLVFLRVKPSVDPSIVYTPQFSLDLENWDESNINVAVHTNQNGLPSSDYERVQATVTIPADNERQFLRIFISR